ncbi:hypothetical protein F5882DRAFT_406407 [Hyaloscypha sp. PMI_1271]|nr:hypothetical protein F5882DRAFT_406407 [Hyaloscypha sp. PMI_1271]
MRRLQDLLRGGRSTLPRADRRVGDQRTSNDVASSSLRSPSDSDPPNPTTSVSVHANHRDMVKFRTENDNGFKRLVRDLMRWTPSLSTGAFGI